MRIPRLSQQIFSLQRSSIRSYALCLPLAVLLSFIVYIDSACANPFTDRWFNGEAEVNTYRLEQERYGEQRFGHAVKIFVVEDFSKSTHVKIDKPENAGSDVVRTMKLNHIRKFDTGVYPYSVMTSVFTPVITSKYIQPLKLNTSIQEWCGHTFLQMNKSWRGYSVSGHSYFQSEGESDSTISATITEDGIWNQIRINPANLPMGSFEIVPSLLSHRFEHKQVVPVRAFATKDVRADEAFYSIVYSDGKRILNIRFEPTFPYKILGWREDAPGSDIPISKAELTESKMMKYWEMNSNADRKHRAQLKIP